MHNSLFAHKMSYQWSTALAVGLLYYRHGGSSIPNNRALGVYQNNAFYSVPLHASLQQRRRCGLISLKGKIFVLGGEENSDTKRASQEVYSFDLVDRTWTRCANMQRRRMRFGTGALDDKIYVFGGSNCGVSLRVCEVYDPAANVWSTIADMMESRANHQVAVLGKCFIVYGGVLYPTDVESDGTVLTSYSEAKSHWDGGYIDVSPSAILIYHPEKNNWVKSYNADGVNNSLFEDNVFVVKGNYHRFTRREDNGIEKYDVGRQSWSLLHGLVAWDDGMNHSHLNELPKPDDLDLGLGGGQAVMVEGELLTVCHLGSDTVPGAASLVQTNGFGCDHDGPLVLELLKSFFLDFDESTTLFPLDL